MAMLQPSVPDVLKAGGQEDKGETARLQYFVGAIAIGDLVKSTLGPKGLDKILQPIALEGGMSDKSTITNDGATILKSVWLDNPAAKIIVDMAMQQDAQCGDGTTGVVVLASELLRQAEQIVEKKVHPQVICQGFRMAAEAARVALDRSLVTTNHENEEEFRNNLLKVARTTLSSKLLTHEKEHFSKLAVEAVLRIRQSPNSLELIQIIKKPGGTLADSYLEDGFLLEKRIGTGQPKIKENCRIMVANTSMDSDKIKIYGARVKVDSFEAVQAIQNAEREKMKNKVNNILAHKCDVFINRQLIYNYPDQLFKEADVMAIEHSDFDGMERLAAALGAEIISTFDAPEKAKLGMCKRVEEIMIGEDRLIRFSGCSRGESCSVVLRGASCHVLDEAERSLHDAIAVLSQTLQEKRMVFGGAAAEMAMADAVDDLARKVEGKKSIAIEAFARALRQIPTVILDNAGLDSSEIVSQLRACHTQGKYTYGIDIEGGSVGDMKELGIIESYKSKLSQLHSATEAAEMIVRVDDIIRCAPRERKGM